MIKKLIVPLCEDDIKKNWIYTDKVYISCGCITFNQKDYIKDTIDGFLAQKTEYQFEIIIHDDLSTDGTRDILLEYKNKYPSIIKLILQDENQYSLGKKVTPIVASHASGEYIALCEGDDFWIDKHKLQKQIVELEKNKDINICFTAAYGLDPQKNISKLCDYKKNKIFNCDDVILGGGGFMPTASLMIRKKIFDNLPDWFFTHAPVGDYYIQILASQNGAIYLDCFSVVYRIFAVGSWSKNNKEQSGDLINFITVENKIVKEKNNHFKCLEKIELLLPKSKKTSISLLSARSNVLFNASLKMFKISSYEKSCKYIKCSWKIKPFNNRHQMLIYLFRDKMAYLKEIYILINKFRL